MGNDDGAEQKMNPAALLSSIFVVHVVAMISPGPNFLIVTRTAIAYTRRAGVITALGIATAAAMWSSIAVVGFSVLFARFGWLYVGIKLLGGLYLIYLAIKLWRTTDQVGEATGRRAEADQNDWQMFRLGLLTNLTNPGSALFFGSVFAALLTPDTPTWVKVAAVGIVVGNSTSWHISLALVFSTQHAQKTYHRLKRPLDRIAGATLGLLALRLLLRTG